VCHLSCTARANSSSRSESAFRLVPQIDPLPCCCRGQGPRVGCIPPRETPGCAPRAHRAAAPRGCHDVSMDRMICGSFFRFFCLHSTDSAPTAARSPLPGEDCILLKQSGDAVSVTRDQETNCLRNNPTQSTCISSRGFQMCTLECFPSFSICQLLIGFHFPPIYLALRG